MIGRPSFHTVMPVLFLLTPMTGAHAQPDCTAGIDRSAGPMHANFASNKPFVPVKLNGSRPLNFILDTGSPLAGLDSRLAEPLGFKPASVISRAGGTGRSGGLILRLQPNACEEMGGARMADASVMSLDLSRVSTVEGVKVDGILGGDFFRHYAIAIDYEKQTVQVLDPSFRYRGNGIVLPVNVEGNHIYTSATLKKSSGAVIEGKFMIDTGVRVALLLNAPFSQKNGVLSGERTVPDVTFGIGAGGETRGDMFKVGELRIGPLALRDVVAFASADTKGVLASPGFAGIVGADLLRRYRVVLDYPHSRIVLEPNSAAGRPFEYDKSGIFAVADGPSFDRIEVLRVVHGSPAELAGIKSGDRLTAIGNTSVAHIGLDGLRQMFRADGKTYSVALQRGGRSVTAVMTTRDLLATAERKATL